MGICIERWRFDSIKVLLLKWNTLFFVNILEFIKQIWFLNKLSNHRKKWLSTSFYHTNFLTMAELRGVIY
jgi:hypothetical protein